MAKTAETKRIERALFAWNPKYFGKCRVNTFRRGFGALEVPVENGTSSGGLIDYARVQECFMGEEWSGRCYLDHYHESEPPEIRNLVMNYARSAGCDKDTSDYKFRTQPCNQLKCKYHRFRKREKLDTVIVCVEIKVSESDFLSKHGHNLVGNINYYAVPVELFPKIVDRVPKGIGILVYYSGNDFSGIRKKREAEYREMTVEAQKWMILSIAKRNSKYLSQRIEDLKKKLQKSPGFFDSMF